MIVTTKKKIDGTIFTPVGIRVLALVEIAEGFVRLVVGKRAPSWSFHFICWASKKRYRNMQNK